MFRGQVLGEKFSPRIIQTKSPETVNRGKWNHLWSTFLVVVQSLLMSNSLWPHIPQQARLPCPSLSPRVCSNSCPLSQWYYLTISSCVSPLSSCLQPFPASGSFPMSQLFTSGGQSIGTSVSASVLQVTIQGWFPLGLTGSISFPSKGISQVFYSTTIQKNQFFGAQTPLWSITSLHDHWKNHSNNYVDLWQQNDVSAF